MAFDCLLRIDGIQGESKISGHEDEIDILSWSWGMSQSGTTHVGGGGGAGKVNINDITFTKYVDKATTKLMRTCCNGEHIKEAVLTVRKAGKDPIDYIKITFSQILVASLETGGTGEQDRLTENVNFNFGKVKIGYTPQKEDGTADAEIEMNWNIEKNIEE